MARKTKVNEVTSANRTNGVQDSNKAGKAKAEIAKAGREFPAEKLYAKK